MTATLSANTWPPWPPSNETSEDRENRLQEEASQKRHSDNIDHDINLDREQRVAASGSTTKILLLGQAESGKSTVLKNFHLLFSPRAFQAKAILWRPVVQLNLLRSINFIVHTLTKTISDISSTEHPLSDEISAVRLLCARLSPLIRVEISLTGQLTGLHMCPIKASEPQETQEYNPAKASEFTIRAGTDWRCRVYQSGQSDASQFSLSTGIDEQNRRVIAACAEDMHDLWMHNLVQEILRDEGISLERQSGFFLSDILRIASESYMPTSEDILNARVTTTGLDTVTIDVEEETLIASYRAKQWTIYDVGGCLSQRAVWMPYVDHVDFVIFLAPISAFDEVLADNEKVNRLKDSQELWKLICMNELLENVNFVLFLNKLDRLKSKLEAGIKFSDHVSKYGADRQNTAEDVSKFLLKVFLGIHHKFSVRRSRMIFPHLTCAVDITHTAGIIREMLDSVLTKSLHETHLI